MQVILDDFHVLMIFGNVDHHNGVSVCRGVRVIGLRIHVASVVQGSLDLHPKAPKTGLIRVLLLLVRAYLALASEAICTAEGICMTVEVRQGSCAADFECRVEDVLLNIDSAKGTKGVHECLGQGPMLQAAILVGP